MRTEEITLEVSTDQLLKEIVRLIEDDDLTSPDKKKIEDALQIEEKELSDFSSKEIADQFMGEELYEDLETEDVIRICEYHDIKVSDPDTIRDQQYDEVFDQLKEKFSVAELEALCNSK